MIINRIDRQYSKFKIYSTVYLDLQEKMSHNLCLMRHAFSQHNREKVKKKQQSNGKGLKYRQQMSNLRLMKELIDPRILNHQDPQIIKDYLNVDQVQLILCSPLKRCLETCAILIKGLKHKVKIVVLPMLSSRLSSAWSIGSDAKQLRKEFPDFDFNYLDKFEPFWMANWLVHIEKIDQKQLIQNEHRAKQFILDILAKDRGENYREFLDRIRRLKCQLKSILEAYQFTNSSSDILIISHSCVLNFLLGKELNEMGKVKNKIRFDHCIPKIFHPNEVFQEHIGQNTPKL